MAFRREVSVALAWGILLAILAIAQPRFFQSDEPREILVQCAPVLVLAVGMTLVILARHIDVSIGSQVSFCAVVGGLLAQAGAPMSCVVAAMILAGAFLGALNGLLVAGLGLPSIVVTLAMLVMIGDGLRWWRQGEFIQPLPPDFQWFGLDQQAGQQTVIAIAAVVFVIFAWGLRNLAAGRAVYATGSDPEAARLVGLRPKRVVLGVFVLMGALSGLAALLGAVCMPQVDPRQGEGKELQVIAAVVVGGVAVTGGRGNLLGPLLGVALLGTIRSALVFLHAEAQWEKALQGAIILLAVASETLEFQRRRHAGPKLAVR